MAIAPVEDHGQKLPTPEGRVVGFIHTKRECDETVKALKAAGFPESKIIVLFGEEGLHLLERSQNDFFMGDGETEMIQLGLLELRDGHYVLGVEVNGHDEAARVASIAGQHDGHTFTYFGTFISERLTK